ncbi:MAG TPA: hypothetical protein VMZ27_06215 [Candidatus Saccharimonadales bacterium]|nr:hypothetical protein [Candidatus Saccharimonadales bacterium]
MKLKGPRKPSALSIFCQISRQMISCRNHLRKLAPRLFDRRVIEARLDRYLARTPFEDTSVSATERGVMALDALASEAWAALSNTELEIIRFQWHLYQTLSELLFAAQERFHKELRQNELTVLLSVSHVLVLIGEWRKSDLRWLPIVPKSVSASSFLPVTGLGAEPLNTVPFPTPPDPKSINLLEKTRYWQSQLRPRAAA